MLTSRFPFMPKVDRKLMTPAEYARHRDCSRQAVGRALREGRITADANGMIDPIVADVQWQTNTRPRIKASATPPTPASDAGEMSHAEAKRREAVANALAAEIALQQLRGSLVAVDDVVRVVAAKCSAAKDLLLGVGPRVAPTIVTLSADEARRMLDEEVYRVLNELADIMGAVRPAKS